MLESNSRQAWLQNSFELNPLNTVHSPTFEFRRATLVVAWGFFPLLVLAQDFPAEIVEELNEAAENEKAAPKKAPARINFPLGGAAWIEFDEDFEMEDPIDADGFLMGGAVLRIHGNDFKAKRLNPADSTGPHLIELNDGTQLHGTLETIDAQGIRVLRGYASAPLQFPADSPLRVLLSPGENSNSIQPHATLQLRSGDWLSGEVLLVKEGRAEVKLASGQRVTIPQEHVEFIAFSKYEAPEVYRGPNSLEGWVANGSWHHKDGVLHCTQMGNIGRAFNHFPESLDFSWTMEKSEVQRNFMISLNLANSSSMNGWAQVRFNEKQIYVYAAAGNKNRNYSLTLPAEAEKSADGKMRYRMLYDRCGTGKLIVFLNGQKIVDKSMPPMPAGSWNGQLFFQPMRWTSEGTWKISDIAISPWDGHIPADTQIAAPLKIDLLGLHDGAVKLGRFEALQGNVIRFQSANGVEILSRGDVRMIRFKPPEAAPKPAVKGTQLRLARRGALTVTSVTFSEGKFIAKTQFAGELTLPKSSIESIVFPNKPLEKIDPLDRIIFANGDQLRGTFVKTSDDGKIAFKLAHGGEANFATPGVNGVLLKSREQKPAAVKTGDTIVRLRNGDWLGGKLLKIDKTSVQIRPSFAENWSFSRQQIEGLYLGKEGSFPIWEGAMEPEKWWAGAPSQNYGITSFSSSNGQDQIPPQPRIYLDGCFGLAVGPNQQSGISQQLKELPEKVDIRFEIANEATPPTFNAQLFYEKENQPAVILNAWQGGLYLYDPQPRRGRAFMAGPQQVNFGEKIDVQAKRHRYRLLADRRAKKIAVFVDGILITQYGRKNSDPDGDLWGTGFGLFSNSSPNGRCIFANLWIGPWNGQLPPEGAVPAAETDAVALANGDEAHCVVESSDGTTLRVLFDGEPLDLPRERILVIEFGQAAAAPPPPLTDPKQLVAKPRLRLAAGGSLTVDSFRLAGENLVCTVEGRGEITMPLSAVSELVWHSLVEKIPQPKPPRPKEKKS